MGLLGGLAPFRTKPRSSHLLALVPRGFSRWPRGHGAVPGAAEPPGAPLARALQPPQAPAQPDLGQPVAQEDHLGGGGGGVREGGDYLHAVLPAAPRLVVPQVVHVDLAPGLFQNVLGSEAVDPYHMYTL